MTLPPRPPPVLPLSGIFRWSRSAYAGRHPSAPRRSSLNWYREVHKKQKKPYRHTADMVISFQNKLSTWLSDYISMYFFRLQSLLKPHIHQRIWWNAMFFCRFLQTFRQTVLKCIIRRLWFYLDIHLHFPAFIKKFSRVMAIPELSQFPVGRGPGYTAFIFSHSSFAPSVSYLWLKLSNPTYPSSSIQKI